jgi:hypothetical protein
MLKVALTLSNPLKVPLRVRKIKLETAGGETQCYPASVTLAPLAQRQRVVLALRVRGVGEIVVTGVQVTLFQLQGSHAFCSLPRVHLPQEGKTQQRALTANVSMLPRKFIAVAPVPKIWVDSEFAGAENLNRTVFHGEIASLRVTMRCLNASLPVSRLSVKFAEVFSSVSWEQQARYYMEEEEKSRLVTLEFDPTPILQQLPLAARSSLSFPVTIHAAPSCSEITCKILSAGPGVEDEKEDGKEEQVPKLFGYQSSHAITWTVSDAFKVTNLQVQPSSDVTNNNIILYFTLTNATRHTFRIKRAGLYADVGPGSTGTVLAFEVEPWSLGSEEINVLITTMALQSSTTQTLPNVRATTGFVRPKKAVNLKKISERQRKLLHTAQQTAIQNVGTTWELVQLPQPGGQGQDQKISEMSSKARCGHLYGLSRFLTPTLLQACLAPSFHVQYVYKTTPHTTTRCVDMEVCITNTEATAREMCATVHFTVDGYVGEVEEVLLWTGALCTDTHTLEAADTYNFPVHVRPLLDDLSVTIHVSITDSLRPGLEHTYRKFL